MSCLQPPHPYLYLELAPHLRSTMTPSRQRMLKRRKIYSKTVRQAHFQCYTSLAMHLRLLGRGRFQVVSSQHLPTHRVHLFSWDRSGGTTNSLNNNPQSSEPLAARRVLRRIFLLRRLILSTATIDHNLETPAAQPTDVVIEEESLEEAL